MTRSSVMVKTPLFGAALLVVVLACVGGVVAQDGESVGAYVPCLPTGANTDVIKGERAYMCITWNNRTRALFTVNADEYAMLDLQNSNLAVPEGTGFLKEGLAEEGGGWRTAEEYAAEVSAPGSSNAYYVTVSVSAMGVDAPVPKIYKFLRSSGSIDTVNLLTAIVHVHEGEVVDISWDEGCFFCAADGDQCVISSYDVLGNAPFPASLAADYTSCIKATSECAADDGECDLKLYIAWTGTDKNGDYMTSAGLRFSRYRAFGAESLLRNAQQRVSEKVDDAGKLADNVEAFANENL